MATPVCDRLSSSRGKTACCSASLVREAVLIQGRGQAMILFLPGLLRSDFILLAVVAVGLWPAAAEAAVLSFRNETDSPIMVQGISVINRVARRGKLHVLRPGEVGQEPIFAPGSKLIIIADAKQPTRILCQEAIQFTGTDLFYAIQLEESDKARQGDDRPSKAKGRRALTPKVRLVPSKPMPAPK
jgi:hypothetical protein